MKKFFLYMAFCLIFCTNSVFAGQILYNPDKPFYENERYGFSVSFPPGNTWDMYEAESGDGVTVRDMDDEEKILVYGTREYVVLEQDFDTALAEEVKNFGNVEKKNIDSDKKWFTLSGTDKDGKLKYLKCFFGADAANLAIVTVSPNQKLSFEYIVKEIERSFKPGFK